jgi:hypothetical protein
MQIALQPVANPSRRRASKPFSARLQAPLQTPETAVQPGFSLREMRPPGTCATVPETETEFCEA